MTPARFFVSSSASYLYWPVILMYKSLLCVGTTSHKQLHMSISDQNSGETSFRPKFVVSSICTNRSNDSTVSSDSTPRGSTSLLLRYIKSNRSCRNARSRPLSSIVEREVRRSKDSCLTNRYEYIDSGNFMRLERISGVLIKRSCPTAIWPSTSHLSHIWDDCRISYTGHSLHCISIDHDITAISVHVTFVGSSGKKGIWKYFDDVNVDDSERNWTVTIDDVGSFSLQPSEYGQIGLFPEQMENWTWIQDILRKYVKSKGTWPRQWSDSFTSLTDPYLSILIWEYHQSSPWLNRLVDPTSI